MLNVKKAGRLAGVTALAASTALAGPTATLAQAQETRELRLAQAEERPVLPPEAAPQAEPAPEAAPEAQAAPEPAPVEAAPEPEPEPQPEPEPAPAPEPEAPAAEAAPEPAPVEEAVPVEAAPVVEEAPVEAEPEPEPEPAPEPEPEPEPTPEPTAEDPAPVVEEAAPAEEAPAAEAAPETPAVPGEATEPEAPAEPLPDTAAEDAAPAEAPAPDTEAAAPEAETAPDAESPATDGMEAPATNDPETDDSVLDGGPDAPDAADALAPIDVPADPATSTDGVDAVTDAPTDDDVPTATGEALQDTDETATETPGGDQAATTGEAAAVPTESPEPVPEDVQLDAVPEGGVAASDARVQSLAEPVGDIPSATAEQGERIETTTIDNSTTNNTTINNTTVNNTTNNTTVVRGPERELPPGAEVVERVGDRDILSIVGAGVAGAVVGGAAAYFIRGDDSQRIATDAEDRYYERLPGQRIRETVVRPNGIQVVTITDRYGDTIQRSRILPDGREVVLFYDPYQDDAAEPRYFYDPGADLPPLQLAIPEEDYIVDVSRPDEELYYRTIVAPPVETVERIYSVDEVRRSERVRDKVRRIDLNTINFAFGSDDIGQDQVGNLQALADAIARVVDQNPDETFLIEGHTDAVGSEVANLALSDRRAEAVASALTQYFDVPPENLITQGYGEQFLKVNTQEQNAENRRVTVRRITPLVKPVQTSSSQ